MQHNTILSGPKLIHNGLEQRGSLSDQSKFEILFRSHGRRRQTKEERAKPPCYQHSVHLWWCQGALAPVQTTCISRKGFESFSKTIHKSILHVIQKYVFVVPRICLLNWPACRLDLQNTRYITKGKSNKKKKKDPKEDQAQMLRQPRMGQNSSDWFPHMNGLLLKEEFGFW